MLENSTFLSFLLSSLLSSLLPPPSPLSSFFFLSLPLGRRERSPVSRDLLRVGIESSISRIDECLTHIPLRILFFFPLSPCLIEHASRILSPLGFIVARCPLSHRLINRDIRGITRRSFPNCLLPTLVTTSRNDNYTVGNQQDFFITRKIARINLSNSRLW